MSAKGDPFDASASGLGYLYQSRVALLYAMQKTGALASGRVMLEGLDDVEFEDKDGNLDLFQLKHRITRKADLSNASVDLWKALRVWMVRIGEGTADLERTSFHLVTTSEVSGESAVALLGPDGRDPGAAARILAETASRSKSKANGEAYRLFLAHSPRSTSLPSRHSYLAGQHH